MQVPNLQNNNDNNKKDFPLSSERGYCREVLHVKASGSTRQSRPTLSLKASSSGSGLM